MATKAIRQIKYTDTLVLSECSDGFFLYDYSRGMNVVMRAKDETASLIEALIYYQARTNEVENKLTKLTTLVENVKSLLDDENI
jgi:hypothetical protein